MKKIIYLMLLLIFIITGCNRYSQTEDLEETTEFTTATLITNDEKSEVTSYVSARPVSVFVDYITNPQKHQTGGHDSYYYDLTNLYSNLEGSAAIMEAGPPSLTGKWKVIDSDIMALERDGEDLEGQVLEFYRRGIFINGEELKNPVIYQDYLVNGDYLRSSKIFGPVFKSDKDMKEAYYARLFGIEGELPSNNCETYIEILYCNEKFYLLSNADYELERIK